MANTLSFSAAIQLLEQGTQISVAPSNQVTLSGNNYQGNIQSIGSTSEIITLTDVGSSGYVFLKNLDATNFVSVAQTNPAVAAAALVKLLPGEWCFFPTPLTAIYAIADTSACDLQIIFAER